MFKSERSARIASSLVLIPLCAVLDYFGGKVFAAAVLLLAFGLAVEWLGLALKIEKRRGMLPIALFAVVPAFGVWYLGAGPLARAIDWDAIPVPDHWVFLAAILLTMAISAVVLSLRKGTDGDDRVLAIYGLGYIVTGCLSAVILRDGVDGFAVITWLISIVVATDIGAYISGRTIGGPKLWPSLSPKKTWAGLIGGATMAGVVGALLSGFEPVNMVQGGSVAVFLAVVAQGGDLLESTLKRRAGVKDSGHLIPGHGGVLDRLDGFLAATPVFLCYVLIAGTMLDGDASGGHGLASLLAGLVD